jgi:hypothetical protein
MFDWQTLGTIVAVAGVTIALIALAHEIRVSRDERAFDTFIRFLDAYENQQVRRRAKWKVIKETVRLHDHLAHEVRDTTNSVDYLTLRSRQLEAMYAIEHELLEEEIRSLNIVNQLCRLAIGDENRSALLAALFSGEIAFYQNKLADIHKLRESQKGLRLFSVMRSEWLTQFNLQGYHDQPPR